MSELGPRELGETLLEIQKYDTRVFELRNEIEGLAEKHNLQGLAEDSGRAESALREEKQKLEEINHEQHKLDGELELLSGKIKEEEQKLFSGQVMNPKELSAIQQEIISLRKRSDEMETEDLELMEAMDASSSRIEELEKGLAEVRELESGARREYERELAEKEEQVLENESRRDVLRARVDRETLDLYDKLLVRKGGLAVVPIEEGSNCGGCHIQFSLTQIDKFQHTEGIFRCDVCGRILVK